MQALKKDVVETRIERKRREKRKVILEKALIILNEQGLHNISLNQLAKSLDYVPAAIYRYFSNWEELLFNLQILVLEKARLNFQGSVDLSIELSLETKKYPSDEEIFEHILALSEWCCAFSKELPNEFGLLSQMIADPKHLLGEQYFPSSSHEALLLLQHFIKAFEVGKQSKALDIEDSNLAAFTFIISTLGLLQSNKLSRYIEHMPTGSDATQSHTAIYLKGLGAKLASIDNIFKTKNLSASI